MHRTFLFLLTLSTSGCVSLATFSPVASLTAVERPASARERYGEQVLSSATNDSGLTKYTFEDRLVKGAFFLTPSSVAFDLTNKTDFSIRILWDEVTMVLPDGTPSAVMHLGTKYTECANTKTPSVIPKGVTITDVALPCKRVRFGYQSWVEDPLIADLPSSMLEPIADSTIARIRTQHAGKKVSLLLPLQIEGVTNEYTFTFVVDSIRVTRPQKP